VVEKQVLEKSWSKIALSSSSLEVLQLSCHDHVNSSAGIGVEEY